MIRLLKMPESEWDERLFDTRMRCVYLHVAQREDEWECSPHTHERLEIGYIRRGSGRYTIGGEIFDAVAGDVFVVPGGVPHCETHGPDGLFEPVFLMVEFTGPHAGWVESALAELWGRRRPQAAGSVRTLFESIVDEAIARAPGYLSAIDAHLRLLFLSLLRLELGEPSLPSPMQEGRARSVCRTVQEHIAESLRMGKGAELSPESIARRFYYHPKYLARVFRQETGRTLGEAIADGRLEQARLLLGESDAPIEQIARQLGFSSIQHFYRAFKGKSGVTPGRFRAQYRRAPRDPF